ncbi:ankyrin repeat-containing domain protein [Trichoderma sp. SZMC 28014]
MSTNLSIDILLKVAQHLDCNGQYALLRACPILAGHFDYSRHLLAEKDSNGNNLVHMLALNGEEALLKSLFPKDILMRSFGSRDDIPDLKQKLLARSVNDKGATPIHLAAEKGHLVIVKWIAKCPAVDLTCEDKAQRTCIGRAAMVGQTEVVSLLLVSPYLTTDWNTSNHHSNPICLAAEHGHVETLRTILERHGREVNVNSRGAFGTTALSLAVLRKREAIIEMLLQRTDTDVNAKDSLGDSALHMALRSQNHAALKLLLARLDINPNVQDQSGYTPLQEAVCVGDEAAVRILLENPQTDVNLGDSAQVNPLIKAVQECHKRIAQLLLQRPDIIADQKDHCGMTAFAWAAFLGRSEIAEMLLDRPDVDPNSKDKDGMTPLSLCMKGDSEDIAEFLIYRDDVEINAKDNFGWTALAHARCGSEGVSMLLTKMLLEQGATMDPYPEWYVMANSTHSDIAMDMVAAMIGGRDLEAYMVERFGQEQVDEALKDGQHGLEALLFQETWVKSARWTLTEGIRYREGPD